MKKREKSKYFIGVWIIFLFLILSPIASAGCPLYEFIEPIGRGINDRSCFVIEMEQGYREIKIKVYAEYINGTECIRSEITSLLTKTRPLASANYDKENNVWLISKLNVGSPAASLDVECKDTKKESRIDINVLPPHLINKNPPSEPEPPPPTEPDDEDSPEEEHKKGFLHYLIYYILPGLIVGILLMWLRSFLKKKNKG